MLVWYVHCSESPKCDILSLLVFPIGDQTKLSLYSGLLQLPAGANFCFTFEKFMDRLLDSKVARMMQQDVELFISSVLVTSECEFNTQDHKCTISYRETKAVREKKRRLKDKIVNKQ